MKKSNFEFKYRVVDGAVDIADDFVSVELDVNQVEKLILAWDCNFSHDGTFDIDFADGVDEMIENRVEEDAREKYGEKIKVELHANIYDLENTVNTMKNWYKGE